MENKRVEITYKNITIHGYKSSNWAYINKRVFGSVIAAKRHITKVIKYFDNDIEKVKEFYNRS